MKTWKIDIVGGHEDAQWHGQVEAPDAHSAKIAGLTAAKADGWISARHAEVYVTMP